MNVKLCKDCKWMENPGEFAACTHPKQKRKDFGMTGFEIEWRRWKYCSLQRQEGIFDRYLMGTCGKGGRWWEPK